ncbi:hypothetical protein ABT104_29260 [Streptomyces mobaraensis]|uniref:hypothetical protein n=1 Tax=Streptomyces mobaraensis TaxID=35621 RepID=UPI00331F4722
MTRRSLYTLVYLLSAVVFIALTLLGEGLFQLPERTGPLYVGAITTMVAVPCLLAGTWRMTLRKIDHDAEHHARAGYVQCYKDVREGLVQPGVAIAKPRKVSSLRDRRSEIPERNAT